MHRAIKAVQGAEDTVAVVFAVGDDADGDGADGFLEALFALHPLVHAPKVALARVDGGFDAKDLQTRLQLAPHGTQGLFVSVVFVVVFAQDSMAPRVEVGESEVFELDAEIKETEATSDSGIDIQRFVSDALLFVATQGAEGLHIVQTVGEFDDKDARVVSSRQEHFAETVGDSGLRRGFFQTIEFADTIDKTGDIFAKFSRHVLFIKDGVFEDVMQEPRLQYRQVETLAGENTADGNGVDEVGFAGLAALPFVSGGAIDGAAQDFIDVFGIEVFFQLNREIVVSRLQGCRAGKDTEGLVFESKRRVHDQSPRLAPLPAMLSSSPSFSSSAAMMILSATTGGGAGVTGLLSLSRPSMVVFPS